MPPSSLDLHMTSAWCSDRNAIKVPCRCLRVLVQPLYRALLDPRLSLQPFQGVLLAQRPQILGRKRALWSCRRICEALSLALAAQPACVLPGAEAPRWHCTAAAATTATPVANAATATKVNPVAAVFVTKVWPVISRCKAPNLSPRYRSRSFTTFRSFTLQTSLFQE